MTIGDITLDFGAIGLSHMITLALTVIVLRHFQLLTALLLASLPERYAKRVLKVLKHLNESSTTDEGGDNHSGTPRRKESLKRTWGTQVSSLLRQSRGPLRTNGSGGTPLEP